MGTMIFELPTGLPEPAREELERSSVAGGQDDMPYPTEAVVEEGRLVVSRRVDESGKLLTPFPVAGRGHFMTASATLMERPEPYRLAIELARGKVNQVRGQAADWVLGGLLMSDSLQETISNATRTFGRAVAVLPDNEGLVLAEAALAHAFGASQELVRTYVDQVFQVRHHRQPRLDTLLACRLHAPPPPQVEPLFLQAFNAVMVPFHWSEIEPEPGRLRWEAYDAAVSWAVGRGLKVIGGPLVDFSGRNLPDWLWERETDPLSLGGILCDFVETVARRYHDRVHTWQVSAGSNHAGVLAHRDDELLWLATRLVEALRKVNPQLEAVIGLAHPWGDYLAEQPRQHSPFMFADTLLRTGMKISGIELEVVMGVAPRGSYCRDTLDLSRLLDLYALLGVPFHVTLGYPSAAGKAATADADQRVAHGYWRDGYTEDAQADWAAAFASLVLCKPYVRAVQWAHLADAEPHQFPHCGLLDPAGRGKPALDELARLRAEHLR